jgi:hypothetical protein
MPLLTHEINLSFILPITHHILNAFYWFAEKNDLILRITLKYLLNFLSAINTYVFSLTLTYIILLSNR